MLMEVISYDTTQFGIIIQILLFIIFMWIGYEIPAMNSEGTNYSWHLKQLPYIGGLFVLLGGLVFVCLSFSVDAYLPFITGGFLKGVGFLIAFYGSCRMLYYPDE